MNEPLPAENVYVCTRCGDRLSESKAVWLELSTRTGRYSAEGVVAREDSQGCFPFGRACAAVVLENNGRNAAIRKNRRG